MNKHAFQLLAKSFRAGRISLEQFTKDVFAETTTRNSLAADLGSLPELPTRSPDSHKGNFGRVLILGGSLGMAGAIGLTALAALRAGAGLVKVAIPEPIQATVASYSPCYMTIACTADRGQFSDSVLDALQEHINWADVLVVGPGMGRGTAIAQIVAQLYRNLERVMVVDADGLNALSDGQVNLAEHAGPRILTPHAGELKRLIPSLSSPRTDQERAAKQLAATSRLVVLLKGHRTFTTDGSQDFQNQTGNAGMATGGTGDVLSGMIGGLLGQGMSPLDAARLAVHWHGLAGDLVATEIGQHSLIASDLIDSLGAAAIEMSKA